MISYLTKLTNTWQANVWDTDIIIIIIDSKHDITSWTHKIRSPISLDAFFVHYT